MKVCTVILAAGEGRRLKSNIPKYKQQLGGWTLLTHSIENAKTAGFEKIYLVMGSETKEDIKIKNITVIEQKTKRGTADAFGIALKYLPFKYSDVLLSYVDIPLIRPQTLKKMTAVHKKNSADITVLTMDVLNPRGYGRIIRDNKGEISEIKEDDLLTKEEREIKEINVGVYVFKRSQFLEKSLARILPQGGKKEKYLTEIIKFYHRKGLKIASLKLKDSQEGIGINNRLHLVEAGEILFKRNALEHIKNGVTIMAAGNTYIERNVKIGRDTVIYPLAYIESGVKIGRNCIIGPSSRIRSGSYLENNVSVGNFVEIVRSYIGSGTKVRHFSYLGDAIVGKNVNIGAGCVTANYDGKNKNKTVIENNAFIGSNTTIVAPVKIGEGAVTGAGAVVTKNNNVGAYEVVAGVPARVLKKVK